MGLRVIGGMTPRPRAEVLETLVRYAHTNAGDPRSYPEVAEALERLVKLTTPLVLPQGGVRASVFTSGASEGNLLALYALRERGARRVVFPGSTHYSVEKAARILGMEAVRVPVDEGFLPRLDVLERVLGERDVLVLTLGTTETGFIDPASQLEPLARERGAWVHLDAAYAGPLLSSLGNPKAPTRLGGPVASLVVDLHKVPEAPIGSGLLLLSEEDLGKSLRFPAPYLPTGYQYGILGTRPGGNVMASLRAIELLLEEGASSPASRMMEATRMLVEELEPHGYRVRHPLETPVACLEHPRMEQVAQGLEARGYSFYRCMSGRGVRVALLPHSLGELDEWISALKRASLES